MKIVQLVPELDEGGVERGTVDLSRALVERGHESYVICWRGRLAEEVVAHGGRVIEFDVRNKNLLNVPARVRGLRRILREIAPDVIHARSRVPAWLAWLANRKLGIPFVTTVHGFNSVNWYSAIMARGDVVICGSGFMMRHVASSYGVPESRLRLIPRGVDLEAFDASDLDEDFVAEFRQRHGLGGKFVIVQVARITQLKDQECTIRAFVELRKVYDDVKLLLVGGVTEDRQAYFERLKALVADAGVVEDVIFAGSTPKVKEIFSLSQINVSASNKPETFGRANVEGMVMGVPLVATNIGATEEYVVEGKTGYFFEPGDHMMLKDRLVECREARLDSQKIHDFAVSNFSLAGMIDKTLAVYRSLT